MRLRIPIAPEGRREILLGLCASALLGLIAWRSGWMWFWPIAALPGLVVLGFFRDPDRSVPAEPDLLVAPADGRVTHVEHIDRDPLIGGPAVRLSIFLSVLDVHINRSPWGGRVVNIRWQNGVFHDAREERSASENYSNSIVIAPDGPLRGPIVVRQIAGKIARRIVCHLRPGEVVQRGQRFGMIKFGSRTDLIIPAQEGLRLLVQPGSRVYAGKTPVAKIDLPGKEG